MKSSLLSKTVIFALSLSAPVWALTLQEAVDVGLKSDASVEAFKFTEKATLQSISKAQAGYLPRVDAVYNAAYERQRDPDTNLKSSYGSIGASYNLFDGFATKYAVAGADAAYQSSQYLTQALQADTKLLIEQAYVGVLRANQQLKVRKEALELLEKNFKDTHSFYKQGLVAKNSLLETQVALSLAKQELIKAQSALTLSKELLGRRLGRTLLQDEVLEEVPTRMTLETSLENFKGKALSRRSEIKSYEAQALRVGYQLKGVDATRYPTVALSVSHTLYGDDFSAGSHKSSYDNATKAEITLTYNLYDGGVSQSDRLAYMYTQKAVQANLESLKQDIALQVEQAYEAFKVALENVHVAKDRLAFAKENFYIVDQRYKVQIETTSTLLDARLNLTQSQVGYVNATYDVFETYAKLQRTLEE